MRKKTDFMFEKNYKNPCKIPCIFRMAWRCQVEPYLKSISSKVTKCESASYKLKNKKVQGFNVHIEETVFFPEGGGQPGDAGIIKDGDNITVNTNDVIMTSSLRNE